MQSLADQNNLRMVVTLPVGLYEFLVEAYQRAISQGLIHPDELIIAGRTWNQLKAAQTVQMPPPVTDAPEGEPQGKQDA